MTEQQSNASDDQHYASYIAGGEGHCSLTPRFWDHFIKKNWEKEELVHRSSFVTLPISEEDLLGILVVMSNQQREGFEHNGQLCNTIRVYIDNEEFTSECFHLYPNKGDASFATYSERVEEELGGKEFAYVIDAITMPPVLKQWTNEFLKGMYGPLKAISLGHYWSIFYGNYTSTPYGVHEHTEDTLAESAFYFPIVGNKQMKTWRPAYVEQHPELIEAHDYSAHEAASTSLSADPKGIMYWPSDRWHIGSSAGGDVSIVLAVKAFVDGHASFFEALSEGCLTSFMPRKIGLFSRLRMALAIHVHMFLLRYSARARENQIRSLPFDPEDLQGSAASLPVDLKNIGKSFEFLLGKKLEIALSTFWLVHLSTLGLMSMEEPLPPITPVSGLRVKRHIGTIMLWRQVAVDTLIVVSDRYFHEVPQWFLPVVEYICGTEDQQELTYDDLLMLAQEKTLEPVAEVLNQFVSFLVESHSFAELNAS